MYGDVPNIRAAQHFACGCYVYPVRGLDGDRWERHECNECRSRKAKGTEPSVPVSAIRDLIATSGRFCRPRQPSIPIEDIEALIARVEAAAPTAPATIVHP